MSSSSSAAPAAGAAAPQTHPKVAQADAVRRRIAEHKELLAQAAEELEETNAKLAAAQERARRLGPKVKNARVSAEERRDEVSVFLARRQLDPREDSLRRKAEAQFEAKLHQGLEEAHAKEVAAGLQVLKKEYLVERRHATSRIKFDSAKERKAMIRAAIRGKWVGAPPTSRQGLSGVAAKKTKKGRARDLDTIPLRYPHSLFERGAEKKKEKQPGEGFF